MLTILIITLVFAHNHLVSKDPRECKCHVENASKLSGSARSLNIFLQAPGIVTTKGKLSRTEKVITLGCFSLQRPVQVNLLLLEKVHEDLRNQTAEKCALQSLKVVAIADRKPAISHTWVLLTRHRENFQRTFILREKVFLAGISNCAIRATLPTLKAFPKSSTVPPVHQGNKTLEKGIPSTHDKDMLNIQKTSIVIKAFMACVLLACAISYMVFVIYDNSCPYLCPAWISSTWSRRRSLAAARVPVRHPTAALLTPFLKGTAQKPQEAFV